MSASFKGRYVLQLAVVGQIGVTILDDGSIWLVLMQEHYSKVPARNRPVVEPIQVRAPVTPVP